MSEPWFNPMTFGAYYGGIVGGGLGSFVGVFGAIAMSLAMRGRARGLTISVFVLVELFGIVNLFAGIYALCVKQPYAIWYPMALVGVLMSVLPIVVIVQLVARYAQAEARKLDAQAFRNT